MTYSDQWAIRSADKSDTNQLSQLLDEAQWLHQHLDWLDSSSFLGQVPFLLALSENIPTACIASPLSIDKTAWIRVFASTSKDNPVKIWDHLWPIALEKLQQEGCQTTAALVISAWFEPLLVKSGFEEVNAVIFLEWLASPPPEPGSDQGTIRGMRSSDIEAIIELDHRAFNDIWSNPREELLEAFKQAALCTVLEQDEKLLGYQISTASTWGAHLARLAVDPDYQGKGIGRAIVTDLMRQVRRRGYYRLTVNTQEDNTRSYRLYRRLGFMMTGDRYPVYKLCLLS
jgi:ribosomal-protein-alanine N-acetyltransferase